MATQPLLAAVERLGRFLTDHPAPAVLTGAGISTASGIPAYRDPQGIWIQHKPIDFRDFVRSPAVRQRYWARSYVGWPRVGSAQPNAAHLALARLHVNRIIGPIITQNVDGLHTKAGHEPVLELHGNLDTVICLTCNARQPRSDVQLRLQAANPSLRQPDVPTPAPDGDAHLPEDHYATLDIPACDQCGGILKPDVVFFGENVPRQRVEQGYSAVESATALLVIGSSLAVYSGFRFCRHAQSLGKPVVAVNLGQTRADEILAFKLAVNCVDLLQNLADQLLDTQTA